MFYRKLSLKEWVFSNDARIGQNKLNKASDAESLGVERKVSSTGNYIYRVLNQDEIKKAGKLYRDASICFHKAYEKAERKNETELVECYADKENHCINKSKLMITLYFTGDKDKLKRFWLKFEYWL